MLLEMAEQHGHSRSKVYEHSIQRTHFRLFSPGEPSRPPHNAANFRRPQVGEPPRHGLVAGLRLCCRGCRLGAHHCGRTRGTGRDAGLARAARRVESDEKGRRATKPPVRAGRLGAGVRSTPRTPASRLPRQRKRRDTASCSGTGGRTPSASGPLTPAQLAATLGCSRIAARRGAPRTHPAACSHAQTAGPPGAALASGSSGVSCFT